MQLRESDPLVMLSFSIIYFGVVVVLCAAGAVISWLWR